MNGYPPPYLAHAEGPSASVNVHYTPKLNKNDLPTNLLDISLMNLNADRVYTEKEIPRKQRVEWTHEVRSRESIRVVGAVAIKSSF
jgi:hypothetical protein